LLVACCVCYYFHLHHVDLKWHPSQEHPILQKQQAQ